MIDFATQLPINRFLGTGATFAAAVNFIVQLAMCGALIVGGILAKQKRYGAQRYLPINSSAAQLMDDWSRDVALFSAN